jgi:hypothetical protein
MKKYKNVSDIIRAHTKALALPKSQTLTWWERGFTYQMTRNGKDQ